ncbi:hypothetical protein N7533_001239 [Penicillium manginii]|uniref:uncharacterized protein n=1 Tax=Penicillium manginii TaxID=203109 RepID=UPI00254963BA|nr:uncharacterized protein N7533_001239 [Penicillium manginii]KAJ5768656.1 hypothetical protein N7533_001239 [Penicillium manginii]
MVLKACDRCHSAKEKCTFADDSPQCTRCRRLKLSCSISRRNRRIGRRPAAKAFPHGQMQVWSAEIPGHQDESSESSDNRDSLAPSTPSVSFKSRSPSSASDVAWTPVHDDGMSLGPEKLLASPTSLRTMSDALRTVSNVEQFAVIHMPFMWGPSFIPSGQKAIYTILSMSGPTLTEGYLAFLGLMTRYQRSLVMRQDEPDMSKAAMGLQRLRSVTISHDYDAACALFLGQTMYVFNVLTAPYSSSAHSIVRSALMSTKQWIPRLIQFPIMDTITMTPILIDTVECLAHREIPIIRLPLDTGRVIIDRYAGLCATLLTHLYDLCAWSHTQKREVRDTASDSPSQAYEQLAEIEERIQQWRPPSPPHLYTDFGQNEVLAMVTQANTYRLAALLVVHRLRYPLGVEDEAAHFLANSIFSELSYFVKNDAMKSTALPIVFPITLAMFEVEGPGEELLDKLAAFTVQNMSAVRLRGFVNQVRTARQSGYGGIWFELVDSQLHVAMPP